ncbi:palmitoleoyl-protein carboxylesterase NOTUM [Bactrocera tryoni]|uniref:palmitoleoyl-protein carboxylesterase NOTUM n=1 Tax=Bactrocera tryoni TaxID=59916 RepID=UPI001A9A0E41|nr:palmitoleoyl-protein carboxylesterase NOTUM [Bactrocera tryoni]
MARPNFNNNERMLTTTFNTTTKNKNMSSSSATNQRTTSNRWMKHNNSSCNTINKIKCSQRQHSDHSCSTTIHKCLCPQRSIAYLAAHKVQCITLVLQSVFIALLCLALIQPTYARSAKPHRAAKTALVATPPIAESLVGNAAASGTFLNSSNIMMSANERNSLDLGATTKLATPVVENRRALKLVQFNNMSVVCNDGSRAGFYLRKNPNSKKWIVFLEGGWHCFDARSCRARWLRLRHLMTSTQWPEKRDVGGILSPLPEENPYWHSANHVLVPYCSSDSWSGTRDTIDENAKFRFMGAVILRNVIAELIPLGLGRIPGAELLLVGSSAGGLGVMLNLDRITNYLQQERKLMVTVRGVSDSGWFLDREPYTPATVGSSEAVRQGWKMWQGSLPEACVEQYQAEPWRCYFGYRLYPTLKAPLFVFQWLFDEAQMRADNVGAPVTPQQWNYIHEMGGALRSSLDNVTGVFAPSCIGHAVLSKRDWINIKIDDISLPSALRCWEHSTRPRRRRHNIAKQNHLEHTEQKRHRSNNEHQRIPHKNRIPKQHKGKKDNNNYEPQNGTRPRLSKAEREERRRLRHERQQRRQRKLQQQRNKNKQRNRHERRRNEAERKRNNNLPPNDNATALYEQHPNKKQRQHNKPKANGVERKHRPGHKSRKERKEQRQQQQLKLQNSGKFERQHELQHDEQAIETTTQFDLQKRHMRRNRVPRVPEKCALRLLERCSWPQCNHSCPMVTNPLTGEEMRFLELLTSFGLDIEAVAAALGIDMQTLSNMDRTELINLLTQQAS